MATYSIEMQIQEDRSARCEKGQGLGTDGSLACVSVLGRDNFLAGVQVGELEPVGGKVAQLDGAS